MAVYLFARVAIRDRSKYAAYENGFLPIFRKYNGEILVVDDQPEVFEGDWGNARAVLIKFPSREDAERWFQSVEYQELAKLRRASADSTIVLAPEATLP